MQIKYTKIHLFFISLLNSFFLYSEIVPAQLVGNVVNAAAAPRIAPQEPPHAQKQSLEKAVLFERLRTVRRTARVIFAPRRKQRTYKLLIDLYKE